MAASRLDPSFFECGIGFWDFLYDIGAYSLPRSGLYAGWLYREEANSGPSGELIGGALQLKPRTLFYENRNHHHSPRTQLWGDASGARALFEVGPTWV